MRLLVLIFVFLLAGATLFFPTAVWATSASLSCSPSVGNFNVGDQVTVDYILNTRSFQAFGADLNITYDATILEATTAVSTPVSTPSGWTTTVANTVDSSLGKIHLDFGNTQAAFNGSGTIGKITFRTKKAGQAEFKYTFFQQYDDTTPGVAKVWGKKDGTNLSNILTDVTNCIYVVSGPITNTPAPTSVPGTPAPTVTALPRAGTTETTVMFLAFSLLLLAIGGAIPVFVSRNSH